MTPWNLPPYGLTMAAAWGLILAIGTPAALFFAGRWGVRRVRRWRS